MCTSQTQNPHEYLNQQTKGKADAVEIKVKGQGKGQTLASCFAQPVQS